MPATRLALASLVLMTAPAVPIEGQASGVRVIDSLDLARFMGRWHEVARFPNQFQRRCAAETTAEYELLADGTVRVVNRCLTAEGDTIRAEGRARRAGRDLPASRLKVRFAPGFLAFLPWVWADYWVLDLTDDYTAALIGTPDRRYLWILARTPTIEDSTWLRFTNVASAQGFDLSRLVRASPAS